MTKKKTKKKPKRSTLKKKLDKELLIIKYAGLAMNGLVSNMGGQPSSKIRNSEGKVINKSTANQIAIDSVIYAKELSTQVIKELEN